ncbi:MAG: hypothetical protein EOO12_00005 [Chitinophagaceae bacterium]|nr:MAG: hypothetical protein EOO12_00005 [Chitinophagaceae bacterium]
MTIFLESGTRRGMGRPPLKDKVETINVMVRIPADVRDRIDAIAGENKRGQFMREAAIKELERREREARR